MYRSVPFFVTTALCVIPLTSSTCEAFQSKPWSAKSYRRVRSMSLASKQSEFGRSKYFRLQSRALGNDRKVDFQSAIVSLIKYNDDGRATVIDLHALCHFGDKAYFEYFNDRQRFTGPYERVHYELIVSKKLLSSLPDEESLFITQETDIAPSLQDVHIAKQYQLQCQLNVIDYTQPKWVHCDYTREEFIPLVTGGKESESNHRQPLWALASTQSSIPAYEFASALLRPLTPSVPLSSSYDRRLFSNLFISGDSIVSFLRLFLWFLMPSPELSVMLLDWSSLIPRPSGGISRIVNPVLTSLFSGDFLTARKLVFAQMLTSGQASSTRNKEDWIIQKRNENAIDKIMTSINTYGYNKHAVLYGALHCQDLQKRLETLGYSVKKIDYRTVWSVSVPEFGTGRVNPTRNKISWGTFSTFGNSGDVSLALVIAPLYLLVGGLDWLDAIDSITRGVDTADLASCFFATTFYLIRHIALYLAISKFFIDWDGPSNLFEGDERI